MKATMTLMTAAMAGTAYAETPTNVPGTAIEGQRGDE